MANHRAVTLARENVRRHGLEGRVAVRRGDLLDPVPGLLDLIVANLPYAAASSVADHPELASEPFAAVFAAGDGLEPYGRLADTALAWLAADGVLLRAAAPPRGPRAGPSCRRSARRSTRPLSAGLRVPLAASGSPGSRRDRAVEGAVGGLFDPVQQSLELGLVEQRQAESRGTVAQEVRV